MALLLGQCISNCQFRAAVMYRMRCENVTGAVIVKLLVNDAEDGMTTQLKGSCAPCFDLSYQPNDSSVVVTRKTGSWNSCNVSSKTSGNALSWPIS